MRQIRKKRFFLFGVDIFYYQKQIESSVFDMCHCTIHSTHEKFIISDLIKTWVNAPVS